MRSFGLAVMLSTILLVGGCGQSSTLPAEQGEPKPQVSTEQGRRRSELLEPAGVLEGIWFTNFENSRFLECNGKACGDRPLREWASIVSADRSCSMLDDEARRIAGVRGNEAPTGWYRIRFIGRRSPVRHAPRYIGDGEREVSIERILDMRKVPSDN
jgi:hypothetical protein